MEKYDYELEPLTTEDGRGFFIRRLSDGQRLQWQTLLRSEGLEAEQVAGVSFRLDALQHSSFAPGKVLSLVPELENPYDPHAVAVYNQDRTLHIGYLPKEQAKRISKELNAGQRIACFAMWETIEEKRRVALRVLLVYEGTSIRFKNGEEI